MGNAATNARRRRCRRNARLLGGALVAVGVAGGVEAEVARAEGPYRLEANAYGRAEAGVALLSVGGDFQPSELVSIETMLWAGTRSGFDDMTGDALVAAIRLRDAARRGELRLGRFVASYGAIRPIHLDGASLRMRLPFEVVVEAFAGIPVAPEFGADVYDWAAGTRIAKSFGEVGSIGLAYAQQRQAGRLSDQELGLDGALALGRGMDLHGRAAYDLLNPGLSEVLGAFSARVGDAHFDVFASHRVASRILPSTSIFTVLGNVAATRAGVTGSYRAAPRLSLLGTAALRVNDGEVAESLTARATLALDDERRHEVGLELRREGALEQDWTGIRTTARVALVPGLRGTVEAELVIPDDGRGQGSVYPWALAGVTYAFHPDWDVAGALEASSTATVASRLDGVLRLTYRQGGML